MGEPEPDRLPWAWIVATLGIMLFIVLAYFLRDDLMPMLTAWFEKFRR